jgi:hypothetical protein
MCRWGSGARSRHETRKPRDREEEWMKKEKGGVGCGRKIERSRNKEMLNAVCAEKRTLTSKTIVKRGRLHNLRSKTRHQWREFHRLR